jgi:hypothetical protein
LALDGKQLGMTATTKKAVVDEDFRMVLIDDASYSGTQALALMYNAEISGLFNLSKSKGSSVVLAGVSKKAKQKLQQGRFKKKPVMVAQCDPMPSGPFGSNDVLKAMRSLPIDADRANASKGTYAKHLEVNPDSLKLQSTTGEFFTFTDLSYAIPPYKIPDSLSVPVHVLMACGYKNDDTLPRVMYGAQLPKTLPHLFTASGAINYRTTLRDAKDKFLKKI